MWSLSMLSGGGARMSRSPAMSPTTHRETKGMRYPADPPRAEQIIAVMRQAGDDRHGLRVRAVIAQAERSRPAASAARFSAAAATLRSTIVSACAAA